jgi:hypothetical protein
LVAEPGERIEHGRQDADDEAWIDRRAHLDEPFRAISGGEHPWRAATCHQDGAGSTRVTARVEDHALLIFALLMGEATDVRHVS